MKEIAPSITLRKWFDHDPAKWHIFNTKYMLELRQNTAVKDLLDYINKNAVVTFLYAAHDEQHNHALVLHQFISKLLE